MRARIRITTIPVVLGALVIAVACRSALVRQDFEAEDQKVDVKDGRRFANSKSHALVVPVKRDSLPDGWPTLFGAANNGTSPETDVITHWPSSGPPIHWQREIGYGYGAPVTLGDRLVIFHRKGDEEIVECLDPRTGDTRWAFNYPTSYQCPVAYSSGPYSTPVLELGRVYAWGTQGKLHCLDLETGEKRWRRNLNDDYEPDESFYPVAASPLVEGDLLILNVGGCEKHAGVVAVDKHTGNTRWTATDQGQSCATPRAATIHGRRHVFVLTCEGLVSLDPEDGRVRWTVPFRPMNPEKVNATTPVVDGDIVFLSGYSVGALCLQVLADGSYTELWRDRRVLDSQYNTVLCIDGCLYGFSATERNRSFRCVDLRCGSLRWRFSSKWLGRGNALAVAGSFLLLGEAGHLATMAIDPEAPQLTSKTADSILPGPCYTAPVLHRGFLYLRQESTLLCLDLRPGRG